MGIFKNVSEYKDIIRDGVFSNQELLKLIAYPVADPLSKPDIDDVYELEEKHIFFRTKNISFEGLQGCFMYVTMKRQPQAGGLTYSKVSIYIDIICGNSIWSLKNGEDRVYSIADKMDDILNGREATCWIGKANFEREIPITPNKDFSGIRFVYECSDFNLNYSNGNNVR